MLVHQGRSRLLTLSFFSLLIAVIATIAFSFLRIASIYCYIEYANCPPEITSVVREVTNQRLLLTDVDQELQSKLEAFPTVRLVSVQKVLPNSLYVRLEPQKVEYVLQDDLTQETLVVTDTGRALTSQPHPDWPVFRIESSLFQQIKGSSLVETLAHQDLVLALTALKTLEWPITSVYLPDWQTIQVESSDKPIVLFTTRQVSTEVQRAKDVLANVPPAELTQVKEIDLRYRLPVLRESISIPRHDSL